MALPAPGSRRESVTSNGERRDDATTTALAMLQDQMRLLEEKEEQLMEAKKLYAKEVHELKDEINHLENMRKAEQDEFARLLGDTEEDLRTQLDNIKLELTTEKDLRQQDAFNFQEEKQQLQTMVADLQRQVQQMDRDYNQKLARECENTRQAEERCAKLQADFDLKVKTLSEEGQARELSAASHAQTLLNQCEELRKRAQDLSAELQDTKQQLQSQCEKLRNQASDLSTELQSTKSKLIATEAELSRRTSELEGERQRVAEEKTDWESRYSSLLRQCEALTAERSQLTAEIEELTDAAGFLRDEAQQQRQEMEEAYQSVTSVLEHEREDARKEAERAEHQIQQLRGDHEQLKQEKLELEAAFAAAKGDMEKEREAALQERQLLQRQLEHLKTQMDEALKQKDHEHNTSTSNLQRQRQEELENIQKELDRAQRAAQDKDAELLRQSGSFEARVRQLQEQQADLEARHTGLQENHTRLASEREALGRDFDGFRAEAAEKLRAREEEMAQQQKAQEAQHGDERERWTAAQAELQKLLATATAELERKQKEFGGERKQLEQSQATLEQRIAQLDRDKAKLSSEVEEALANSSQLRAAAEQRQQETAEAHEGVVNGLQSELAGEKKQRQQVEHARSALEEALRAEQQKAQRLEEEVADLGMAKAELASHSEAKGVELERVAAELNATATDLRKREQELSLLTAESSAKAVDLQDKNAELLRQSESFEARVKQLQEQQADLEARHSGLQENHARLATEHEALGRDFDGFRADSAEKLRAREEETTQQQKAMQAQHDSDREQWTAAQADLHQSLSAASAELQRKQAEFDGERKQLEQSQAELENRVAALSREKAQLSSEIEEVLSNSSQLRAGAEQKHHELVEAHRGVVSNLQGEVEGERQQRQQVEQARVALEEAFRAKEEKAQLLAAEAAELEKHRADLASQVKAKAAELEQTAAELGKTGASLRQREQELEHQTTAASAKATELQELSERHTALEAERGRVAEERDRLRLDLEQGREGSARELSAKDAELSSLREEANRLRAQGETLASQVEAKAAQHGQVSTELLERNKELAESAAESRSRAAELEDLRQRHAKLEEQRSALEVKHGDLQESHDQLARERGSLRRDFDTFRAEAAEKLRLREEEMSQQQAAQEAHHQKQREQWTATQAELEKSLSATGAQLESQTAELDAERTMFERSRAELEERVADLSRDKAKLSSDIEEVLSNSSQLRVGAEQKHHELVEAHRGVVSGLQGELESERRLRQEVEQARVTLEEALHAKEEKAQLLEGQAESLEKLKAELGAKLDRTSAELSETSAALQQREQELKSRSAEATAKAAQLQELQDRHAALEVDRSRLADDGERLRLDLAQGREVSARELSAKEAELAALREEADRLQARGEDLQGQVQAKAAEHGQASGELQAVTKELSDRTAALQAQGAELEDLRGRHATLEAERRRLADEIERIRLESERDSERSVQQLAAKDAELLFLRTEGAQSKEAAEAELRGRSQELQEERRRFQAEQAALRQEKAALQDRLDQKTAEAAAEVERLHADKAQQASLLEEVQQRAEAEQAALHREKSSLQDQLERKTAEAAAEIERLQGDKAQQASLSEEARQRAEAEQAALQREKAALQREKAALQERLDQKMAEASAEVQRLDADKALQASLLEEARQRADNEQAALQKEKAALQDLLDRKTAEAAAEIDRLQAEKVQQASLLEESRQRAEAEQAALQQEKAALQDRLDRKTAEAAAEVDRLEADKAQLSSLLEDVQAECDRKLDEENMHTTSRITQISEDFERQLAAKEGQIMSLRDEIAGLVAAADKEKAQLHGQLSDLEVAYEQKLTTQEERSSYAISELKNEYKQEALHQKAVHEEQIAGLTQRLQQQEAGLVAKDKEVQERMSKLQEERDQMSRRLEEWLQSREDELRRQAEETQAQTKRLTEDLDRAQDQAQRLAADKINLLSEMAQAQADADQLLCDTKASFEARLTERSRALAEMEEAHSKVEALHKSCIGELQAAHADYSERLQAKDRELADKRAQIKTLGTDVAEQEAKIEHLRVEVEQYQQTHIEMDRAMAEMKSGYERRLSQAEEDKCKADKELEKLRQTADQEKEEMSRRTQEFFKECEQKMQENDSKVTQTMAEFHTQRNRLSEEKAEMNRRMEAYRKECENKMRQDEEEMRVRMESFRADCDKRMKEEQEAMARMTQELHNKAHEQVAKEQQAAERRVAEIRAQTEEQLKSEREVSDSVRHVLRELPPLQAAMELGDMASLDLELSKWRGEVLSQRFGDCRGVVEAVVNMAKERLHTWRGVDHTWKEVIREVERMPSSLSSLTNQCQRLFRALKEAQLTKMDLRRSDPTSVDRALEVLLAWKDKAMVSHNSVQTLIVRKVMHCHALGPFDFTDLDICLRLVDRPEDGVHQVFLSRAKVLVEDEKVAPKELKGLLAHIETMLFFLKYAKSEDLSLTHKEFKKQTYPLHPAVSSYLDWAESAYRPGRELVDLSRSHSLMDGTDVTAVLQAMRTPHGASGSGLDMFREIFYQWAVAMRKQFNLLVLPHHTQVVCLLAFQRFLEAPPASRDHIHALIAQVGTGEGKSMIVAALAVYVVVALRKKVHVVVDDETLLERDFASFRRLFDAFLVEDAGKRRPLKSMLCVSEERLAASKGASGLAARVDADADICYCEAKHVQSFYASIARNEQGKRDFDSYAGRVLILDEVDALVIDEEPNEPFVYPNNELSEMATSVAQGLFSGKRPDQLAHLRSSSHPAANRVFHEVCKEWERGRRFVSGEDYVYSKESGRYCALHAGRANPKAWSLALECRNFQDGLSKEIFYQERLFVMSRPRVFRRYHRILGLSGSIGSEPERKFLQETYRAAFFEVPPFLKTCRGSPFHEPLPAKLGDMQTPVYVEETVEAQTQRIAEVAFEARERVPVLIIAKDRVHADQLVESLRLAARSRGLGSTCEDAVRSLSRTLYEAEPEQWKENLNRATMPLGGAGDGRNKTWRLTVTDRRGGRGTDYRVDDSDVDGNGGLLLIPSIVPTSQREWIQFLGRTARQDRRGQYCAVLCAKDYVAHTTKFKEKMPTGGCSLDPVKMVLGWGDRETAERIKGSAALYNCGVRVNELCEEVFGKRSELLKDPQARERLVDVCQRLRWMSVREVDEAFARLPSLDPKEVPSEARDLGRPEAPPSGGSALLPVQTPGAVNVVGGGGGGPKVVIFCLDWSASMKSNDTRTQYNRFQTCVQCILRILRDQVRDNDLVGVVCFGPTVQTIIPPTPKGVGGRMLQTRIASLQPATAGGTCFYDAVLECLKMLGQPNLVPPEALRWLVCLTDGDDLGSSRPNQRGQLVSQMLGSGSAPAGLNMVMITVGSLKSENVQVIQSWVKQVTTQGGQGVHLGDKDATGIAKAFDVVAEFLAAEVGGATEC